MKPIQADSLNKRGFQPQKLFIEGLRNDSDPKKLEKSLRSYFSNFGSVIDSKILRTGELKRQPGTVRLCDLQ
jgi:hypothetical protein